MRASFLTLILGVSCMAGPWSRDGDLRKLPDPKPWNYSEDLTEVIPLDLKHCSYDILGSKLSGLSHGKQTNSVYVSSLHWKWLQTRIQTYRDSVLFAVHDSIKACLVDLKKSDIKAWCVERCLYEDCDWKDGFWADRASCLLRGGQGYSLQCDSEEYIAACLYEN